MIWNRTNGEKVKVDDYDLFQNGAWIPNAIRFYLEKWFPNLLPEFDQQVKQQVESQPDYDTLIGEGFIKSTEQQIEYDNCKNF